MSQLPEGQDFVHVCFPCGHAERARRVVNPIPDWEVCTAWEGVCDCCGKTTGITHVRDFHRPWHRPLAPGPPPPAGT
jgi:hypothetical protein